jgi:hypothetical protein
VKIDSSISSEERAKYKVVRADDYTDLPGEIMEADETTGEVVMIIAGEKKTFSLGHGGIRIIPRR